MTELRELVPIESVTVLQSEQNPQTGYYRLTHDHDDDYYREKGFVAGELVYVYAGKDAYHAFIGESEWTFKYDQPTDMREFLDSFIFVPDGAKERQDQITAIMQDIADTDLQATQMHKQMVGFAPHADHGELATGTALVPRGTNMVQAKQMVAAIRNTVLKTKKDLARKTQKLKQLATEQSRALAIKVKEMTAMVEQIETAIWTINLYLGKNEEIHVLKKGEPSPATEKITIRQNVLFMDEECAIAARTGGIDIRTIEEFDDWLLADDDHITQVLPERKGIIALHIKRQKKDYECPWANMKLNEANLHWTYFLIRNGENVYRVFVDIVVGQHLFPTVDEFEDLFWESTYNHESKERERRPLKPGSDAYMKAMEASEDHRKHYLRILLVLQGLMDRTPIFKPMPTDQINLCDPRHCDEWLHLIYEAENILTDGKPTFDEWQETINQQLDIGHRIIGLFDYASGIRKGRRDSGESRIYPATANYPDSMVLHTIEERDGEKYVFRYERTGEIVWTRRKSDKWYDNHGGREPEVRARCWVTKRDGFILNFDAANLTELEYYMNHRLSRYAYQNMIPLLRVAIDLKKQETAAEEPFRQLLIGQCMQRYGLSQEAVTDQIDDLIRWWKFKNRTHRALLSDDSKALTMIVDEFGLRRKQAEVRERAEAVAGAIIETICNQTPSPVLVAHKSNNKYVAYVPHNDQNVWVTEQTWSYNRQTGDVKLKDNKEWKLVDKRHERWQILYQHARWASWRINPAPSTVLTDPEIAQLVDTACEKLGTSQEALKARRQDRDDKLGESAAYLRFLLLCAYHDDDFKVTLWYSDVGPILPEKLVLSNRSHEPSVCRVAVRWKRGADGVKLEPYFGDSDKCSYNPRPGLRPWEKTFHGDDPEVRVVRQWPDNIELLAGEFKTYREHKSMAGRLEKMYDYAVDAVAQVVYDRKIAAARAEFDTEYGDPELWEDHLKDLKIQKTHPRLLDYAFHLLAERDINAVGMSLQQVYDEATKYGLLRPNRDFWDREERTIPADAPLDFVVPPPPAGQEDDEDDEDED
jgi:hypothetical protein